VPSRCLARLKDTTATAQGRQDKIRLPPLSRQEFQNARSTSNPARDIMQRLALFYATLQSAATSLDTRRNDYYDVTLGDTVSDPTPSASPATAPAGWYPDPMNPGQQRWWDGATWAASAPIEPQDAGTQPSPAGTLESTSPKKRNALGIVALVVAALGFIFACMPGALVLGWILLPIGLVLGIVAVCLRGKSKWAGFTAIVLAVVGTIAGIIVFMGVVASAFDSSFGNGSTSVTVPETDTSQSDSDPDPQTPAESAGTRANPLPYGTVIENDDWTFQLTGFNGDATAEVLEANQFNTAPAAGQTWVILDAAATYKGSGEGTTSFVQVDYVSTDGTILSTWDSLASGVEPRFGQASLYAGATDAGRQAFLAPIPVDGLIRVKAGMFADDVFFSLP